jgi:hypothetical protein
MNQSSFFLRGLSRLFSFVAALATLSSVSAHAQAVQYSPAQGDAEGNIPYTQTLTVRVFKPRTVSTATVSIAPTAVTFPIGTASEALSYISVSPNTVTYSASETFKDISVTITFPRLNITPGTSLIFQYKLFTTGWPSGVTDAGWNMNATVTAPPPSGSNPPTVTITQPVQTSYSYSALDLPAQIPFTFEAATSAPSTIFSIDATVNGQPLTVNKQGIGTILATGTGNIPVTGAGTYTIVARAANVQGDAQDTKTLTVVVNGPNPTVKFSKPVPESDYTYFVGGSPVNVPVAFTAQTPSGTTIQNLTATLNGALVSTSVTGLNTQNVTGTIPIDLTASGHYTLRATATNEYGQASDDTSFWINRVANPVSQTVYTFNTATFTVSATGAPSYTYRWARQAAGTTGFVNLSDGGAFSGTTTPTLSVAATMPMNGDQYICYITGLSTIASAPATLTVLKLTPTLTWPTPAAITYGTPLSATQLNAVASVTGTSTYIPASGAVLPAGTRSLRVDFVPTDLANYNSVSANVDLVVNKAPLTVTASSASKVYGAALPAFTYAISGFVNNDTQASAVTGAAAIGTSATASSPVGTYSIVVGPGSLAAANYSFAFVPGVLTIIKADQTITFPAPAAKVVGDPSFALGATVNSPLTLSYSSSNTAVATVNSSGIVTVVGAGVTLITVSQPGDSNYNAAASVTQSLTVTAAPSGPPTIVIDYPTNATIDLPPGQTTTNVSFRFTSTPYPGTVLNSVSATFDSVVVSASTSPALPTNQVAVSTGTLVNVGAGSHTFVATARSGTSSVSASVTFVVNVAAPECGTALVRHAAVMNGLAGVHGSLQILLPESMAMNGNAWVSGDLLVPGTPSLRLNGTPTVGSQVSGTGSASPSNHTITLNGNALIGRLVRRTDAVALPTVATPPASTGTRNVRINQSSDSIGNFATLRDLTITGNVGLVAIAPGTYRDFTVSGNNNGLILGIAGSSTPAVYNFANLDINGQVEIKVVGPVVITVANEVAFGGRIGNADRPEWTTLKIANGGLTLNGTSAVYGTVVVPNGTVTLNGLDVIKGGLAADRLVLNGQGLLKLCRDGRVIGGSGDDDESCSKNHRHDESCRNDRDDDDDDDRDHDGRDGDDDDRDDRDCDRSSSYSRRDSRG